jgi:6-phosphogluconolactonase
MKFRVYGCLLAALLLSSIPFLRTQMLHAQDPKLKTPFDGSKGQNWIAYVGTYTQGAGKGIYAYHYTPETGAMTFIGLAAPTVSPSFLALHPNGRYLYAVNESRRYSGRANSGSVTAFVIDPATGMLTPRNTVASLGADPCHLVVDHSGRWLIVANYSGGSLAVFPIQEDGSLGEASQVVQHQGSSGVDPARQEGPHVHSVNFSDDNRFLYSSDLGLDTVFTYAFDAASGKLTEHAAAKTEPGAGPRHIAFSPDRHFGYGISELTSTITVYRHDAGKGTLEAGQTVSTLPSDYKGPKSGAEVALDPSGHFLYASNRGHDSIAIFHIDPVAGHVVPAGHVPTGGKSPRYFTLDPTGAHLIVANQDSSNLVVFDVDRTTGALTLRGDSISIPDPVCIVFVQL